MGQFRFAAIVSLAALAMACSGGATRAQDGARRLPTAARKRKHRRSKTGRLRRRNQPPVRWVEARARRAATVAAVRQVALLQRRMRAE